MSGSMAPMRPLAGLKHALRQCRAERQQRRAYAEVTAVTSSPPRYRYPLPSKGFRPSQATKQNRFEQDLRRIPVVPPPRSTVKLCHDPVAKVFADQLKALDPNGQRTRLFADTNPERAKVGDILLVRLKSGDTFSGVCLNIRRRNSPIDTAILLRNQLTRVGVEMWYKIYSPNVDGIEVVQRKQKRARRAKLYYMRQPRHDIGSVENIVRQYQRQRTGGPTASRNTKGRDANSNRKKKST